MPKPVKPTPPAEPTKQVRPTEEERAEGRWFFVFSDPVRVRVIRALADGERTVADLAVSCGTHQVNLSAHTAKMEAAGVLVSRRDGIRKYCGLAGATVTRTGITFTSPGGNAVTLAR